MLDVSKFKENLVITFYGGSKTVNQEKQKNSFSNLNYLDKTFIVKSQNPESISKVILEHINKFNFQCREEDLTVFPGGIRWSQFEDSESNPVENPEKCYFNEYFKFIAINGMELSEKELREIFPDAK